MDNFFGVVVPLIERYLFVVQLIVAVGLFAFSLPKKNKFPARIVFGVLIALALASAWDPEAEYPFFLNVLQYILLYVTVLVVTYISFNASLWTVLFCGTGGYLLQHLAYRVNMLASYGLTVALPYGEISSVLIYSAVGLAVICAIYVLVYFLFVKRIKMDDELFKKNKSIIFVSLATVLCVVILSIGFDAYSSELSLPVFIITLLYIIVTCAFLLFILYSVFKSSRLQSEAAMLERMMHMREEQYAITQNTIDMINVKCHDMKHRLEHYKDKLDGEEIEELEKSISIYDSAVKTGNPALDIVLAENGLLCWKHNIRFTCIAEGESLKFMRDADIYSLFSNAIDNAVAAVKDLSDDKRVITLSVKNSLGFAAIHVENYFDKALVFCDGLPMTTKDDKNNHGYGLKSIKMTVEKYGGCLRVSTSDNVFKLNITMAIPQEKIET